MRSLRNSLVRWMAIGAVLAAALPAAAQTLTGSVAGIVKDQQGGVLPGATVTITGRTGARTTATDEAGAYRFSALEPGTYSRHAPGLQHLAFTVPTRSAVRAVHARVVELGSEILHPPRAWPEYPPPYFAAFWLDPFGFMLEAVCHHDRS